jgi:hypothetical protein
MSRYYPDVIPDRHILVLPIYDYEISGNETPKEIKNLLFHYFSTDWEREPNIDRIKIYVKKK